MAQARGRRRKVAVGLCCTAILAYSACSQSSGQVAARKLAVEHNLLPAVSPAGDSSMVWQIADRMRRYNVPGLGIAVIRDGQLDWSAGYGVTSEASAQAVTGSTVFQAASLSKPVAAVVALSLVTDGVLQLDEDVNQRLRSWTLERDDNAAPAPVPLRALLSHTAGVNVSGFPGFAASESLPTLLQILDGSAESPPVRITPERIGHYSYSGGGYQVAQLLIEETTGSRFEDVARERVLGPFGMSNSTFAVELPSELSRTAARGHRHDGAPVPSG